MLSNGKLEVEIEGNVVDKHFRLALSSVRNTLAPRLPSHRLRKGLFIVVLEKETGHKRSRSAVEELTSAQCSVLNVTVCSCLHSPACLDRWLVKHFLNLQIRKEVCSSWAIVVISSR